MKRVSTLDGEPLCILLCMTLRYFIIILSCGFERFDDPPTTRHGNLGHNKYNTIDSPPH